MRDQETQELIIPFKFEPRDYQLPLLASFKRFKIPVFHRRSGKSKTALNMQISKMCRRRGLYLYLLPTYVQAKRVIWQNEEMMQHFPAQIIKRKNDTELYIKLRNDSLWLLGGADRPESWRGTNPVDVVFDEYSEMKEEIWTTIIRPVLTENKGDATFIFTPKGKNHAWKLLEYAKANPDLWDWWLKNVEDTHAIPDEELREARKEMPQAIFEQEFLCKFIDDASSVFRRVSENTYQGELFPEEGKFYQMGVDLAKYNDWTVLTVLDLHSFKVARQERFNQIDWNLQKARIEAVARRWNNAKIWIDSTGVGDPIYEDLRNRGLRVEPFTFTEQSRKNLLNNLAVILEQDRIKLPDCPVLKGELQSFRFNFTLQGKLKMLAPQGVHDDCVMSLALACWDARKLPDFTSGTQGKMSEFSKPAEGQISRFHY